MKHLLKLINRTIIKIADTVLFILRQNSPISIRDYGHRRGIYCEQLIKLPWLVVEHGNRPDIVSEKPIGRSFRADQEEVQEHLRELGYVL